MLLIDRFEGNLAVCQSEDMKTVNLLEYPENAKEGDCLMLFEGKYIVDEEETKKRKAEAEELMMSLF